MVHRRIVLATGVFDLLHLGHVRFLEASKKKGGPRARLVVIVASDKTVHERKGQNPILPEDQRRELVASLRAVDKALLGRDKVDMLGVLRQVEPDIVCVGYDQQEIWASVSRLIRREKLGIPVVRIPKFGPGGLNSSTKVKERVAERWQVPS